MEKKRRKVDRTADPDPLFTRFWSSMKVETTLHLHFFPDTGNGLKFASSTDADADVLRVPKTLIMNPSSKSHFGDLKGNPHSMLCCAVM